MAAMSRSPADVGATLHVVRVSNPIFKGLFKAANGLAERRLSHAERASRLGEAAFARNGHQSQQVAEIASWHVDLDLICH